MIRLMCFVLIGLCLSACGGSSSSGGSTVTLNVPNLPTPPVSRLVLPTDYVGFFIGSSPLGTDPNLATSQQYTQQLFTLDADNVITPVTFLDATGLALDLTGNVSFIEEANIIPLDIMVMSADYVMLTLYNRDLDDNSENDYFNLLVDLRSGSVVSAPVGLNEGGNSGRSNLTSLGRDYFPPDNRWNDTDDLYVLSIDYEALGMMDEVEAEEHDEIVDHHVGVPCPTNETEEDTDTTEDTDTNTTDTTDTTETTDTSDTTDTTEIESTTTCSGPTGGTITQTTTTTTESTTTTTAARVTQTGETPRASATAEAPVPTNIYRMRLGTANQYTLEKVSLEDDRPGLGQFVVSRSGIMIYRNLDGGDNSYRVILEDCESVTGRLSTVLLAPYTSLIVADDDAGNSSIFEITERGINKLIFSCNGNVIRQGYTGYTERIYSLRLPYNSPSIASYDYIYPYFINSSCQGGRMFPRPIPEIDVYNPLPAILGLPSGDTRGLRKSQMFNGRLYCIGYDAGLDLAVAELDTTTNADNFSFLSIDFGDWLPDFDSLHMLSNNHVIFTGSSRTSTAIRTIMLNTDGEEFDLTDQLMSLTVSQQIEITPPQGTTYSTSLVEE
ncbi:MAG: hypothetical protein HWE18_03715 [Gammaproteobacteria bacterium]|nr:hypothetical protein [Gammaproteobacteria bacterium]